MPPKPDQKEGAKAPGKPAQPLALTKKQIRIYIACTVIGSLSLLVIIIMTILYVTLQEVRSYTDYPLHKLRHKLSDTLSRPELRTDGATKIADEVESLPKYLFYARKMFDDLKQNYRDLVHCNSSTADGCTFEGVGKSRFYFSRDEKTWYDAESFCVSRDAHLASVTTDDEQKYLTSQIQKTSWIGLTDENKDGAWEWSDGSRFQRQYWSRGEPNQKKRSWNADHDCAMIVRSSSKRNWNIGDCFKLHRWVCKQN